MDHGEGKGTSKNLQKKADAATNECVKRALQYMLEVTVEALKGEISDGRSSRACETDAVGAEEEGRGDAVGFPVPSSIPYNSLVKTWKMTTRGTSS